MIIIKIIKVNIVNIIIKRSSEAELMQFLIIHCYRSLNAFTIKIYMMSRNCLNNNNKNGDIHDDEQ